MAVRSAASIEASARTTSTSSTAAANCTECARSAGEACGSGWVKLSNRSLRVWNMVRPGV